LLANPLRIVSVVVATIETFPVGLGKIAIACFLEVVRSLRVIALRFLTIVPTGLFTVVVALVHCPFAVTENVVTVGVVPVRVIIRVTTIPSAVTEWTKWSDRPNDNYSSTAAPLGLGSSVRYERNPGE